MNLYNLTVIGLQVIPDLPSERLSEKHKEESLARPFDFHWELMSARVWGLFQPFPQGASVAMLRTRVRYLSIAPSSHLKKNKPQTHTN